MDPAGAAMKLTPNQQAALAAYRNVRNFFVPPRNQGQIVEVSYGCSPAYCYERRYDRSCQSVVVTAYRHPALGAWDPWSNVPRTGRRIGVIYRGHAKGQP